MGARKPAREETQRDRVWDYVLSLGSNVMTPQESVQHFDDLGDYWLPQQINRFIFEGKWKHIKDQAAMMPKTNDRGKSTERIHRTRPSPIAGKIEHQRVPTPALTVDDWADKIDYHVQQGKHHAAEVRRLWLTAEQELPKTDFATLRKRFIQNRRFQQLLNFAEIDEEE
jgi:hypothetical protein